MREWQILWRNLDETVEAWTPPAGVRLSKPDGRAVLLLDMEDGYFVRLVRLVDDAYQWQIVCFDYDEIVHNSETPASLTAHVNLRLDRAAEVMLQGAP